MRAVFCLIALMTMAPPLAAQSTADDRTQLVVEIDDALARGGRYLVQQQGDDGYWRSQVYGLLKDGPSLTALALWALPHTNETRASRERGFDVMQHHLNKDNDRWRVVGPLEYPVYTASLMLLSQTRRPDGASRELPVEQQRAWRDLLLAHQFSARTGWTKDDDFFGGWGYTKTPTTRPVDGQPLSPLSEPNLSATVFALEALVEIAAEEPAFVPGLQSVLDDAQRFVIRCQNFRANAAGPDAAFNNGGFHFILGDPVRNKPGVAGVDSTGATRFRSYGSATADGLRALVITIGPQARHNAAAQWIERHFDGLKHAGDYPDDRQSLQPALDYYYAASLARTGLGVEVYREQPSPSKLTHEKICLRLAQDLLARQQPDGSWRNPAVDVREDDPLIATSFALAALRECRRQFE